MSARACRLEIVRGDDGWFWRFIASNGKQLARSSETYKKRKDAMACAGLVVDCTWGDAHDGARWDRHYTPDLRVAHVDERGQA